MLTEVQRSEMRERITKLTGEGKAAAALSAAGLLLRETPKPGADASFCLSALTRVAEALTTAGSLRRLRTFVVRSVTLEPMVPMLRVEAALQGLWLELQLGEYGSYLDDPTNPAGALGQYDPDLVLVVLDLDDIAADLVQRSAAGSGQGVDEAVAAAFSLVEQLLRGLRRFSKARVVWQGFEAPDLTSTGDVADANLTASLPRAVAELNGRLAGLCRELPDCVFFDVDRVAARFGRGAWRDNRLFLATRLAVSTAAQGMYARALVRSATALYRAPRKVLCTDLDNTLWGGVLGEEGWAGIATGTAFPGNCFQAYQRYLKQLAARGILLVAVSKNNPGDVDEVFAKRASDLLLTLDDFAARKIGWSDKTDALRELAVELSLGLDSFVFVDDHPVECEAMRQQLPEVATVCLPADQPWRYVELLAAEPFFDTLAVTEADAQRTEEYRAQAKRSQLASHAGSREEFLASLGIVCTVLPVAEAPLARAVQLLGKTNQFNLTTRRHGAAEVEQFAADGVALAVRVRDRFGDAGVVGLALVKAGPGEAAWRIDSFLLSCRVIGRGIEAAMLAEIASLAREAGVRRLLGEYVPSAKNALCANFYADHGFSLEPAPGKNDTIVRYGLTLRDDSLPVPSWIQQEHTTEETLDREPIAAEHIA